VLIPVVSVRLSLRVRSVSPPPPPLLCPVHVRLPLPSPSFPALCTPSVIRCCEVVNVLLQSAPVGPLCSGAPPAVVPIVPAPPCSLTAAAAATRHATRWRTHDALWLSRGVDGQKTNTHMHKALLAFSSALLFLLPISFAFP
jgi:hypothetical protein